METLAEAVNKLQGIKARGYVGTHRRGPTGIGKTLKVNPDIHVDHITQSQVQHGQAMSMPITIYIWYTE